VYGLVTMVAATWPEPAGEPTDPGLASHAPPAGRAAPSPGPFAELLGHPYQRLKVAVLRELAALPTPSWRLADAERALTWLEPATAVRLLGELRSMTDHALQQLVRHQQTLIGPCSSPLHVAPRQPSDEAHPRGEERDGKKIATSVQVMQ